MPENNEQLYRITKLHKSFSAKLCQMPDEVKDFYTEIKNALMSYGLTPRVSRNFEKFAIKKVPFVMVKLTGKQINLYMTLDSKKLANSKYHGKDISDSNKLFQYLFRVKTERKKNWALELIDLLAEEHGFNKTDKFEPCDIKAEFPYVSDEELKESGDIKYSVNDTNKEPEHYVKFKEI